MDSRQDPTDPVGTRRARFYHHRKQRGLRRYRSGLRDRLHQTAEHLVVARGRGTGARTGLQRWQAHRQHRHGCPLLFRWREGARRREGSGQLVCLIGSVRLVRRSGLRTGRERDRQAQRCRRGFLCRPRLRQRRTGAGTGETDSPAHLRGPARRKPGCSRTRAPGHGWRLRQPGHRAPGRSSEEFLASSVRQPRRLITIPWSSARLDTRRGVPPTSAPLRRYPSASAPRER